MKEVSICLILSEASFALTLYFAANLGPIKSYRDIKNFL